MQTYVHLVLTHPACVFFLKGGGSGEACGFKHQKPLPHLHKESCGGGGGGGGDADCASLSHQHRKSP